MRGEMAELDYDPVEAPDDEEERRRRMGDYPPPAPANAAPMAAAGRGVIPRDPGMSEEAPAAPPVMGTPKPLPASGYTPPTQPAPQGPHRPEWRDYAPAESHGWGKFGHFVAAINPITNRFFNVDPQRRAEQNYKNATAEFEAPLADEEKAATAANTRATTEHTKAATDALENPKEAAESWSAVPNLTGPNGEIVQQEKTSGQMRYAPDIKGAKPLKTPGETAESQKIAQQAIIGKIDKAGLPTGPKEIDKSLDAALKKGVITADEHASAKGYAGINPTPGTNLTVHIAGNQQAQDFGHKEKDYAETRKRYETAQDADQRLSRMEASYQKGLKGDQQAMLALLTDHIGMTLGLQKGARITKDILNEAQASQPLLAKLTSKFDDRGYLSGVTLGPDQMKQMLDLGYEARDRAVEGAHNSSKLYGVPAPAGAEEVFGQRKPGAKPAFDAQPAGGKEPERPGNVPANYVYKENGPKGEGWYKP